MANDAPHHTSVVRVHADGDHDVIAPAEDERGRIGVFVFVSSPLTRLDDEDPSVHVLRRNIEQMREYLDDPPESEIDQAQRLRLASLFLASASNLMAMTLTNSADFSRRTVLSERLEPIQHGDIQLRSPTGTVDYHLPLPLEHTLSASDVGRVLSPSRAGYRSIAQKRRENSDLLGVKIGNQYRYPRFQLDEHRNRIHPVAAYANRAWEAKADPWGALDWWFSPESAFGDRRPVDLIAADELTTDLVDLAVRLASASME